MTPRLPTLLLLTSLAVLSGCTSIISSSTSEPLTEDPGSRSLGSYIDDEIIETKVVVNIRNGINDQHSSAVSAHSHNGIVLLLGQLQSAADVAKASEIAQEVKKVRKVHNEITTGARISLVVRSNDTWITTKVKSRLSLNEQLAASKIKVVTENGVVYLMGLVSSTESQIAARIASETKGVQKVVRVFEYF